jgi:branched-chain amino acid transport system permease protein
MDQLPQQLIIGLSVGATYALIALGYTMVYGVLRLINFAHGDVYMVGAVSGYYLSNWMVKHNAPLALTLLVVFGGSIIICAVLGFVIERFAYRPLRSRPRLVVLITAIGVSLLLENLAQLGIFFGPTPRQYPESIKQALATQLFHAGSSISLTYSDILSLSVSLGLMVLLTWVILKTRTGLALRAVSFRFDTAALMGVNTDRIISFTFMFGSSLAAVAGVMGGLLIGLVETLVKAYISSAYADAVSFVILILVLLIKPSGLFGSTAMEKV